MPYFQDKSGALHYLSEQDVESGAEELLPAGCMPITDAQAEEIQVAENTPTAAQLWAIYQGAARSALDQSDKTILRCYENAVVVPTAWAVYRKALRDIVSATTGDSTQPLPTTPAYPAGT